MRASHMCSKAAPARPKPQGFCSARRVPRVQQVTRAQQVAGQGKLYIDPVEKEAAAFAPATVANLGPGFDWMGCAVEVRGTAGVGLVVMGAWQCGWQDDRHGEVRRGEELRCSQAAPHSSPPFCHTPAAPRAAASCRERAMWWWPGCCPTARGRW